MEGKTIVKSLELENGYHLMVFQDDSVALIKVVSTTIQADEIAELIGEQTKPETQVEKPKPKKKEKEPEPEPEEEPYNWGDLEALNHKELTELCKDNDLDTDPNDYDEDSEEEMLEFRKDIAKEIDVEITDTDTPEPEPEPAVKDDNYTWEDLVEMDFEELEELCDEQDLGVDPNDFDEDEEDKLRREIAEELEIAAPKKKKKKK